MQELEKILEELKRIKDGNRKEKLYAKYPPNGKDQEVLNAYSQGYEDGTDNFYNAVVYIIRKHMNDGWNPANKPPETGRRCLVKMKHHAWISDYDSNFVLESEKIYHAEYVEICEAIYQDNDRWTYCDLQDGECTAYTNPKEYPGMPIDEVLEWQYMPHLQPETCKYTGGSCCWPIDQCGECPNNPERSEK